MSERHSRVWLCGTLVALAACTSSSSAPPDAAGDASVTSDTALTDTSTATDTSGGFDVAPFDAAGARALTVNDVSVLFALPRGTADLDELLAASAPARGGALLPAAAFAMIDEAEPLTNRISGRDPTYAALRVVSFRYDPCFIGRWGGVTCQPQIRLVLQPVIPTAAGPPGVIAADGAVHLMFNLDDTDDRAVLSRLEELTALSPENASTTLQLNPTLAAQGNASAYGTALRDLIVRTCGPANLARMTFMTRTNARQGTWRFGGFNLVYADSTGPEGRIQIAGISATVQQVSNAALGMPGVNFNVAPAFEDPRGRIGTSNITFGMLDGSSTEVTSLFAWFHGQENGGAPPVAADSTDCSSCHLAGHVRNAVETRFGAREYAYTYPAERRSGTADNVRDNLRMFGFFDREPVVTARVAHETAAVIAQIAAR